MNHFASILGAHSDELFYVIAVLILSIAGAAFEKLKRMMTGGEENRPGKRDLQLPRSPLGETPPKREPERPAVKLGRERMPPPIPAKRSIKPPPAPRPPTVRVSQSRDEIASRKISVAPAAEVIAEVVRIKAITEASSPQAIQSVQHVRAITAPTAQVNVYPAKSFREMNVAEWRRAIVLNEVLGPPLALRQDEPSN